MKPRSQKQDEAAWRCMNKAAMAKGWKCVGGWNFKSPSNSVHDLSASDPSKIDYIEENELCLMGMDQ